ncbi:hypothetical protein DIPPA_04449 [Diplonema papillatum]|nr:hypothetical protein DIPPA_04449 [Diplonema papillatum]|eukprot:gene8300-12813_t
MAGASRSLRTFAVLVACMLGGAVAWPPWANPVLYPPAETKTVFVSSFHQKIVARRASYNVAEAKQKCNAAAVEVVSFDFRPPTPDLLIDPRNNIPSYSSVTRQFYRPSADMQLSVSSIEVLEGADRVTSWSGKNGEFGSNKTFNLHIDFTPASRGIVTFRIRLDVENFLESLQDYNIILWRPFGPIWEGPEGAFVANATVDITLPWGTQAIKTHPLPHKVPPGKGFGLFTSLRDPLPDELWSDESVVVRFEYDLWTAEYETMNDPSATTPGHQALRVDILFDQQQARCNAYPYWIYLVSVGAALVFFFFAFSVIGFLYFEKPWRAFLQEDSLAARRRLLWKLREQKMEKP